MQNLKRSCVWFCAVLTLGVGAAAQAGPAERTFPYPKDQVEQALRAVQAYTSGRLPILDGFAVAQDDALDRFSSPFYQDVLQVNAIGSHDARVTVSTKITAWYAGEGPAPSGYRVLPSNGRLEADLLDRIAEALRGKAATAGAPSAAQSSEIPALPEASGNAAPKQPTRGAAAASLSLPAAGALSARSESGETTDGGNKRMRVLEEQAKTLDDILHHQSHPGNLAAVKNSRTPILMHPAEDAQVLFLADAEDEFQVLNLTPKWVHVQITGISRGWIRRPQLALPSESAATGEPLQAATNTTRLANADRAPFRQMRQETSLFPGNWEPLRGKTVKIIWVQPAGGTHSNDESKLSFAKTAFHGAYLDLSRSQSPPAGVVIIFDSEDGGMAAATYASLQQWNAHHLSDKAFWQRCWFDPADAFKLRD
jgi:hypothetical protein